MRTHHWLVDGIGALHIANRLFELLASEDEAPGFGNEWKALPPRLKEANGFSERGVTRKRQKCLWTSDELQIG